MDPASGRPTVLRDGSEVLIRPIRGADAPLLADGFARLSLPSRQMRFLTPKRELSAAELRYLTEIDHHDHEALGAADASGLVVRAGRNVKSQACLTPPLSLTVPALSSSAAVSSGPRSPITSRTWGVRTSSCWSGTG